MTAAERALARIEELFRERDRQYINRMQAGALRHATNVSCEIKGIELARRIIKEELENDERSQQQHPAMS
jgi:hypothetical protein